MNPGEMCAHYQLLAKVQSSYPTLSTSLKFVLGFRIAEERERERDNSYICVCRFEGVLKFLDYIIFKNVKFESKLIPP